LRDCWIGLGVDVASVKPRNSGLIIKLGALGQL